MTSVSSSTIMQWEAVGGWQGGTVAAVALHPSGGRANGLLASSAGVYRWTTSGTALEPRPHGMSDLNVVAVTFAGGKNGDPATALAGTATGRLFRALATGDDSDNLQWQEIRSWAGLGVAEVLAPSPAFATDQTLFVGTPSGIYRTQDDGQSWESCNFGLLDEYVLCLACAPNFDESEILWAGTVGGGLYRSRNSGRAWRESGNGLPDTAMQSLVFSPNFAEDRTLFVGTEEDGIYVSRDGGDNWTSLALAGISVNALVCPQADLLWAGTGDGLWRVATGNGEAIQLTTDETVMTVAASAEGRVACGYYGFGLKISTDAMGDPHTVIWQWPDGALHAPPVVTKVGSEIFALDFDSLLGYSDDEGAGWAEIESTAPFLHSLASARIDAEDGSRKTLLFAADCVGLATRNDEEWSWQPISGKENLIDNPYFINLSAVFDRDQTILAGTRDQIADTNAHLQISQDKGATWREISGPWQGQQLLRAQFAPATTSEIVAITMQPSESGHYSVTIWQTLDQGQSWETLAGLTSAVPAVLMAWPQDNDEHAIFLATQHRVIKLFHHGDPANLQLHQHFFDEKLQVTALSLAPDYPYSNIIWAATTGGLYRSVDRGLSWGLMLDLPLGLPVVWLDVTFTHVNIITLGGRVWRAAL